MSITIRPAAAADAIAVGRLSKSFADYLTALGDPVTTWFTPEIYLRDGFGPNPAFSGLVAEHEGNVIGYLLYHPGYDTDYLARTLHVIDLYVQPEWRGQAVGRQLMEAAAAVCQNLGGTQLFWAVSTKNEAALAFYQHLGARFTQGLLFMRLDLPLPK